MGDSIGDLSDYSDRYIENVASKTAHTEEVAELFQINALKNENGFRVCAVVNEDLLSFRLSDTQMFEFLDEYDEIIDYINGSYDGSVMFSIQIKPKTVSINGVSGTIEPREPDLRVYEEDYNDVLSSKLRRTVSSKKETISRIRSAYWKRKNEKIRNEPVETQVEATVGENGELIISTTYLGFDVDWKFSPPKPDEMCEKTKTAIEEIGGGKPKFIDGEYAYIVHRNACHDKSKVMFTEDGEFALVPISLYNSWEEKESNSLSGFLTQIL